MTQFRSNLLISISFLALTAAGAAHAATGSGEAAGPPAQKQPAPQRLAMAGSGSVETVVVTSQRTADVTKTGVSLMETPQNIQVLPAELLQEQGVNDLLGALRNVAGVMPGGYYQSWDYFRIRGFDASGYIYLDDLLFDSGVQLNAELYGLSEVEIVKGPASLYGQGSLGGLVNLVSKRPRADTFLTAGASYGSFDSWDVHLDGGTTLLDSPNIQGRLVMLQRHDGTFTDHAKGNDRTYVAPSLTWNIDDRTSLTLLGSYQYDRTNMGFPLTYVGAVVASPYGKYPITRYTGEPGRSNKATGERDAIGFEFRHRFNDVFSFQQNFRYAHNWNKWDHIIYSSYLGADQRTLYRYPYSTDASWDDVGSDSRLTADFSTGPIEHTFVAGVDYFHYSSDWKQFQIDYSDPTAYMPLDLYAPVYGQPFPALSSITTARELVRDTGIYVQEHAKLDKFTLTLSGRWDFARTGDSWSGTFSAHNDNAFTPRVGVTYEVLPDTILYAGYSESFRPQSGATFTGGSAKPETGQQWEVGTKANFLDNRLSVTASLFQLTRQNVVTDDPLHPGFASQTGEQQSKGFELDARAALAPGWEALASYAYVDAKVTKDNTIPVGDHSQNVPPNSLGFWTKYVFQDGLLKGLGIGGGVYNYSSQEGDLPNTFKLPGYTLVNGVVSYDFGPFTAQLNVENIFNKRYFTGSYNDVYVQPGAPRNYMVHLDWAL